MKKIFFCFAFLFSVITFSQSNPYEIIGNIKDSTKVLESATVYLEKVKDSSLISYTISDSKGKFKLQGRTKDTEMLLKISFIGYSNYKKKINVSNGVINLGTIELKPANMLDEVLVKSTAPITIKKDTLEFNVKSFKTKKDANVEDLLKKLPGVEISEDGKIKVNGKEVNKILVNGKPFFGNDPTITTRNLSKEIIEKIQITDTKTKSEAFAGEEGSKDNKTINLTIKEENNKGSFGRISAGAGTRKTYEFAGMYNRFNNDKRVSVLLGGNNTNSPGFSFGEIQKMFGGRGFSSFSVNSAGVSSFRVGGMNFGGGQGIVTSRNAGVTYANPLTKKIEMNGDYFYSESNSDDESSANRETILANDRYFSKSSNKSSSDNKNHAINMDFDIEIDSTFLINISPKFNFTRNKSFSTGNEESKDANLALRNISESNATSENSRNRFETAFDATKRLRKKGSFIKFRFNTSVGNNKSEAFQKSLTEVFGANPETIDRNQFSDNDENSNGLSTSLTYRTPLAKSVFLDVKYRFSSNKRKQKHTAYDYNSVSKEYDNFNNDLSSDFTYKNVAQTPSVELSYRKKKWRVGAEAGYVFRTLENEDFLRPDLSLKRNFKAPELDTYFRYRFSPKMRLNLGYNVKNRQPSLRQVQPFQDVSNPLNIVTGNPNLRPENKHRFYLSFNNFNFQTGTGFFAYINSSLTNDQIVYNSILDSDLRRTSTYTNVDGNNSLFASLSFSKKYKLGDVKSLQVRLGAHGSIANNIFYLQGVKNKSTNKQVSLNFNFNFNWKNVMELRPFYNIALRNGDFNTTLNQNKKITSHSLGISTATFLPKKFEWRNDIRYSYNSNIADGFQKDYLFWNSTLAYSILKDKGTITLKAYDLLNQNNNSKRLINKNYIEDRQSKVLQQYFMLSFSWKFNTLGKKGETGKNHFMMF